MNAKGIFVTGTDTGVGKTMVSAALLSILRSRGVDAVPMKPVQTGAVRTRGHWRSPDLDFCLERVALAPDPREYALMAPYAFAKACSPHLAAALAGCRIGFRRIKASLKTLQARHAFVIVEGAGGVYVPIRGRQTMLDLMRSLALPVLVVARPGLGTINHTLLTLQSLRRAQVRVLGVVFNAAQMGRPSYIERDNMAIIARTGKVRVLGRLPFFPASAMRSAVRFQRLASDATWLTRLKWPIR